MAEDNLLEANKKFRFLQALSTLRWLQSALADEGTRRQLSSLSDLWASSSH